MPVKQISVFLENTKGRLAEVTRILGENGINLRAVSLADTKDFGILRMVVDDSEKALAVLERESFTAKVNEVLAVEVDDKPGGLARILEVFSLNNVNIEYIYSSLENNKSKAVIIFRVEDTKQGVRIIEEQGLTKVSRF